MHEVRGSRTGMGLRKCQARRVQVRRDTKPLFGGLRASKIRCSVPHAHKTRVCSHADLVWGAWIIQNIGA